MPSSQQVPFEPSLTAMFAQYFHDPAIGAQFVIDRNSFRHEAAFGSFEDGIQAVRVRLIRTEHAKVCGIEFEDVSEKISELSWSFRDHLTRSWDLQRITCKVWYIERGQQPPAIHVRVPSHATTANRRGFCQLVNEFPFFIEEFLRLVASHPGLKDLEMFRVFADRGERDLMSTEGAFNRDSIHFFRPSPTLRRAQDDHGPDWLLLKPAVARLLLNGSNLGIAIVQRFSQELMYDFGIVAFDKIGLVAASCVKSL